MRDTFSAADQNGEALRGTVSSSVPLVEQALQRLEATPFDREALEMMYSHAHTIGRAASLLEYPVLAHLAHGMEGMLSDVLEGFARLDPPTLILLRQTLGTMQAHLQHLSITSEGTDGHTSTMAGRVVESTISEAAPTSMMNEREDSGNQTNGGHTDETRWRLPWQLPWRLKPRASSAPKGQISFELFQKDQQGRSREQGTTSAGRGLKPNTPPAGPRPQEQEAARSIDLIKEIQQQRKTGKLLLRRGSGATAEEGWIQFELGQITRAASGRHRDAEARNWLSTWGSCRFLFEEEAGPSP